MNIMNRTAWKAMWRNKLRTWVTVAGIILSAAMFMAVTTMCVSIWQFLVDHERINNGDYFVKIINHSQDQLDILQNDEHITKLGIGKTLGYSTFSLSTENGNISETAVILSGDQAFFEMLSDELIRGVYPKNSNEIAITENIYQYLKQTGRPCEIGQTVTLDIAVELEGMELPTAGQAYSKEYKIVGILQTFFKYHGDYFNKSSLLTYSDGKETPALWYSSMIKTFPASHARTYLSGSSQGSAFSQWFDVNLDMLGLYGDIQYANYTIVIGGLAVILMGIILLGSVSLIYNSFSISVSERTKQFGLLRSIGATKKQLRGSVRFEAAFLCLMGIPFGILCGYLGICVTLYFVGDAVDIMMQDSFSSTATLSARFSWLAALTASLVGVLTVFISAWIPARRATRIEPISAIRQAKDYSVPTKPVRVGKLTQKLWGLPGLLAKKYYSTSRKKYRSTVVSLAVSILLFITASSFAGELQKVVNNTVNTENFDLMILEDEYYDIREIRDMEIIDKSAWVSRPFDYGIALDDSQLSEEYLALSEIQNMFEDFSPSYAEIYYLEDTVFLAYLQKHGIDPEPYFQTDNPCALVCDLNYIHYRIDESGSARERISYEIPILSKEIESLQLYSRNFPPELRRDFVENSEYDECTLRELSLHGKHVVELIPYHLSGDLMLMDEENAAYFVVIPEIIDGKTCESFYSYDPEADLYAGEALYTQETDNMKIQLGERISELPFGVPSDGITSYRNQVLILPMRFMPESNLRLSITVSDYEAFLKFAKEQDLSYYDFLSPERMYRTVLFLIDVFANGFIILISLICVCNVFNTVTTNIMLRKKDFGILRSVGMKNKELYRMMGFESIQYGIKSLLIGLPLGLAASYGVYLIADHDRVMPYMPPWSAILICGVCVFAVVFTSMLYAVSRLKKDNPIDAIRAENI